MKYLITFALLMSAPAMAGNVHILPVSDPGPSKELILTEDNAILLNDAMMEDTTSAVMQKAQVMDAKLKSGEPIYLVLYTPGGSIQAGLEMITFLKGLNRPVHTVTLFAASMGFQTVQGLGTRYITHFGTLMAHKAKGQFAGEFPGQIDSRYVYYLKRLNEIDRQTVARSGGKLTVASFQALYENEYWVDGFDAVSKGLADEVVSIKCDSSLTGTRTERFSAMGYVIRVTWSKCPTIMGPLDIQAEVATNQGLMTLNDFFARGGSFERKSYYGTAPAATMIGPQPQPAPEITVEGLTVEKINAEVEATRVRLNTLKKIVAKE